MSKTWTYLTKPRFDLIDVISFISWATCTYLALDGFFSR